MCCITKCLLYLAHVLNCIIYLELSMRCFAKYVLYLAFVLNYVFNCQCGCAALENTSYIWRWCWTTSIVWCFLCAAFQNTAYIWRFCWTTSSIVNAGVLHCKRPLIFGACVEVRLSFGISNVLHCKKLLYLALVFNVIFYLEISRWSHAKHL